MSPNNDIEEKREEMGLPQSSSKSHSQVLSNEIGFEGRRLIVSKSPYLCIKMSKVNLLFYM